MEVLSKNLVTSYKTKKEGVNKSGKEKAEKTDEKRSRLGNYWCVIHYVWTR